MGPAGGLPPRPACGRLSWPSAIQTFPCRTTWMPCGQTIRPAPKLSTRLPLASNLRTGSSVLFVRQPLWFVEQRSATQMLVPSGSTSTALVEPQLRPAGIFAQPSIVRYGLGSEFVGDIVLLANWADEPP